MSAHEVAQVAERMAFRPRVKLWEQRDRHVPFDELTGRESFERRAISRITQDACVAVMGASGVGKSSMIAWMCSQLPDSHVALNIPITGVEDSGSVSEVARLAMSIALSEILLDASSQRDLKQARADSHTEMHTPVGISAKLGGGMIPAEVGVNLGSLQEEFDQRRLAGDFLRALNDRLVAVVAHAGITPVFVFADTQATVGADDDRRRAETFFAGPLSAFIEHVDAPTIVAVQSHLTDGSSSFERLAPMLETVAIPRLGDRARMAIEAILARHLVAAGLEVNLADVLDELAIDALADFYGETGDNLRHVLVAAHDAVDHAAESGAKLISSAHARFGITKWRSATKQRA